MTKEEFRTNVLAALGLHVLSHMTHDRKLVRECLAAADSMLKRNNDEPHRDDWFGEMQNKVFRKLIATSTDCHKLSLLFQPSSEEALGILRDILFSDDNQEYEVEVVHLGDKEGEAVLREFISRSLKHRPEERG